MFPQIPRVLEREVTTEKLLGVHGYYYLVIKIIGHRVRWNHMQINQLVKF